MKDYSVFDNKCLTTVYPLDNVLLSDKGIGYSYVDNEPKKYNLLSQQYIFRRNTQIKDKREDDIYEYDLIEFKKKSINKEFIYTGIVVLRRGRFVLKDICYAGQLLYDGEYEITLEELLSNYTEVKVIDNSLKLKECQKNIRNKFYFKVIDKSTGEIINGCHIDNNCNVYNIVDITKKETYSLLTNSKILLSTDTYDSDGNIIFYKDEISFNYKNNNYIGTIEYNKGLYYIDNIIDDDMNEVDFKIPLCDKYTDKELTNISLIKKAKSEP